ncbi:ABC transporter permease [Streptomyces sennicomposti]|uniref:ABC transporter permease n=1 Tax=Streptomyces sennicomposti TaxID=2873384 RepID=UPI001CA6A7F6|nr:ABC transporter permease [Streptomyces sennicomposti]MBY8865886.1 ABC transporter permease [Streptomyces sennicomposti]
MSRTAAAPRTAGGSALTGTRPLLRASLRQEARSFAPWIAAVTALSASSVLAYAFLFPDASDRKALAAAVGGNPALGLIFGPARDLSTTDGFNTWRSLALGGFITALMAIFAVVRASRAQEDSGQAELLASGVLGRSARLAVAVAQASLASLAVGVVSAVVTGLCGAGWADTLLLSATFTVTGLMSAAVAAVAAQLGSDARTASTLAVAVLGCLFVLRGYLDSMDFGDWVSWVTPLGWMERTEPAAGNTWWPLLPGLGLAVVLLVAAFALQARRDFGQGAFAPRPGPARGAVRSPLALAWRLNRGPVLSWTVAFVLLGVVFGNFSTSVTDLLSGNPAAAAVLASGAATPDALVASFLVTILSLAGIIAAISGVQTMLKVRSEELEDRAEPVMAAAVPRSSYLGAHVLLALSGPTAGVLVAGVVTALIAGTAGIGVGVGDVLLQAVATVPAVWTATAVSVAVVGARPQIRLAAWIGVLASFALTLLGPTFKLPDWALGISPFHHVPHVTAAHPDWWGLLWITLVTAAFLAIGLAGFRRRDLAR